ncbi:amidohydrolase, partial [uncultured Aurantimicrobium sp.]|uniref:amidohydrolase n=1 Tax=uncultured Aurantimicrobium sp. TaxID=1705357 RepID=UPI00261E3E3D
MSSHADLIVLGGPIATLDPQSPWAEALAIKDGKILAVGSRSVIHSAHHGPSTLIKDLDGKTLMPGLHDAHNHHQIAGKAALMEVGFFPTASLEEIHNTIKDYVTRLDHDAWVVGGSWGSTLLEELSHPSTKPLLDEAAGGRPVLLVDDSHHNKWANSRALFLAGIDASTPDPIDGTIMRYEGTTEPTGVLFETAGLIVERVMNELNPMTEQLWADTSERGMQILHSYGVTAFQDAGVSLDLLKALQQLDNQGRLKSWVVSCMMANNMIFDAEPIGDGLVWQGEKYRTEHHRPDFIKIFLDGIPPTHTACFLEPYLPTETHGSRHHGEIAMDVEELTDWLLRTAAAGIGAKIHCTGDGAVHHVLDAAEKVRAAGFTTPLHIAHGQFVAIEDIPRMANLNVVAEISPTLWFPGVIYEAIKIVLGPDRAEKMQPNRSILDAGGVVIGGSDWPVVPLPNPWLGIEGLVTRADPDGVFSGTL